MKYIITTLALFVSLCSWSQTADSLRLDSCYAWAKAYHPLSKQANVTAETMQLRIKNLKTAYLPNITLYGLATWQTPTMSFNIPLPKNPISVNIPNDQYKLYLEIQQVIYDGGFTSAQMQIEQSDAMVTNRQSDVQQYQLRQQVSDAYFMGLFLQQRMQLLDSVMFELQTRQKAIASGVKNGVMTQLNADMLQAEIYKTQQQADELQIGLQTVREILSKLSGRNIADNTPLGAPLTTPSLQAQEVTRPEYALFDAQQNKLNAMQRISLAKRRPRVGAFAQGGYGRPGLNMFSPDFEPYFIAGIRLSWTLWDWNQSKRERQILSLQSNAVGFQRESLDVSLQTAIAREQGNINKMKKLMETDRQIIDLRQNIRKITASQMENGIITATEYVRQLNAELEARVNLELHRLQMMQAQVNYNIINGK